MSDWSDKALREVQTIGDIELNREEAEREERRQDHEYSPRCRMCAMKLFPGHKHITNPVRSK